MTRKLPTLFVPHGSPMFALEPGQAGAALSALPATFPTPRAIVVISPHWETVIPTIGTGDRLETIYDFGNFDPRLFEMVYPARGDADLAQQVIAALESSGFTVQTDPKRGLDHGAWVPLGYLYPNADIPVIPLSLQHAAGPLHAYRIGQALAPLSQQGFLIVGSGNITHNLRDWQRVNMLGLETPDYVHQFAQWVHDKLTHGETEALLNYRTLNASAALVHPRDEHFLPLFTALGAAGDHPQATPFHRGTQDKVLAMDGYVFGLQPTS